MEQRIPGNPGTGIRGQTGRFLLLPTSLPWCRGTDGKFPLPGESPIITAKRSISLEHQKTSGLSTISHVGGTRGSTLLVRVEDVVLRLHGRMGAGGQTGSFPYSENLRSSRSGAAPYRSRVRILIFSWPDFWSSIPRGCFLALPPSFVEAGRNLSRPCREPGPFSRHSPLATRHCCFLALPHPTSYNRLFASEVRKRPSRT